MEIMTASYFKLFERCGHRGYRLFSTTTPKLDSYGCKVLVLGGGAAGCSMAAKLTSKLGKNKVIIVEKSDEHYYQPMLTLIGGGIKELKQSWRKMESVLPKDALWIKDSVSRIDPNNNQVITLLGHTIIYDYLIVALGLEMKYDKVKGLKEALSKKGSGVCSNYSPKYVERTFESLKNLQSGNAVFTLPNTPIKCGGAPLKACLISENYLRNTGKRERSKVFFKTAQPVIFPSKHYGQKLHKLCNERGIQVGLKEELIEVKEKEAIFRHVDKPDSTFSIEYSMLHVTPPMFAPDVLKTDPALTDAAGYLKLNRASLQHEMYPNIFGIGDCTNLPTSKTAAAVAAQSGVLYDNLLSLMNNEPMKGHYDGYTSCPLVTSYGKCIMAEFDYTFEPLETFPIIDQSDEHRTMYFMKKEIMPNLYWYAMLNGYWRGPGTIRKVLHLGQGK